MTIFLSYAILIPLRTPHLPQAMAALDYFKNFKSHNFNVRALVIKHWGPFYLYKTHAPQDKTPIVAYQTIREL